MLPLQPQGASRRLLSLLGDGTRIELVTWADGSYGINQDGRMVGIWPASEEEECIKAFYQLGELRDARPCLVVSREVFRLTEVAIAARAILN